jgi:hypothetical protein
VKKKLERKTVKRRGPTSKRPFTILAFVSILALGSILYLSTFGKETTSVVTQKTETKSKTTFYPRQYSDNHITDNAKVSDDRLKHITFFDKTSLLGNVVSSLKKNDSIPETLGEENGSWLWTPILQITPEYRNTIISGAKRNGVKNLYVSIDSYLDIYVMEESEEREKLREKFDKILSDFVTEARKNNITVDAEAGWRNWAEIGHSYKAFATLNYAIDFNKKNKDKLRGFQYDVEPYLLEYYKENKKSVLGNFINLIDEAVARLDGTDLVLSVVIPEFYDEESGETPPIFYAGKSLYTVEQLLRILDKREGSSIIVMSYRNFSRGVDGTIDISKEEINTANKYSTKIIIAQETGDVLPPYITFYNTSKSHYERQLGFVLGAFKNDKSFNGTATHYVNAFLEL